MAKKASKAVVSVEPETTAIPQEQTPEVVAETAPASAPAVDGATEMPCATCGQAPAGPPPVITEMSQAIAPESPGGGAVLMRFTGTYPAPVTFLGLYPGCVTCAPVWVDPGHVARLEGTGQWARVETPEAQP